MFETHLTVVGNIITDPVLRSTSGGDVASFRMASNVRRKHPDTDDWYNAQTLYVAVSAWGKLAKSLMASLEKGRQVIVSGTIWTSEYTTADGQQRQTLEMKATAIGLDLSRCIVKVCGYPEQTLRPVVEVVDPDAPVGDDEGEADDAEVGQLVEATTAPF